MEKSLILIADSHLGVQSEDVESMCQFIETCNPELQELVFLGDLFHIWAGPAKFHTSQIKKLLNTLETFQQNGGATHLVVGNRDVLFQEYSFRKSNLKLPFNRISLEFLAFENIKGNILCAHGDTVNSHDSQYLRWKKTINNPVFKGCFNLLPTALAKTIMLRLEKDLQNTNMQFRREFPDLEWTNFMKKVRKKYEAKLLIIGHFHPTTMIVNQNDNITGIVLPAWCDNNQYLELEPSLNYSLKQFQQQER